MLDQLTSAQLSEWEAFNRLEPVGEFRRDYRIATLTSIIYNFASSFGGKSGKRVVSKPQDFMLWLDQPEKGSEKEQSVDEMKEAVFAIAASAKKTGPPKNLRKKNV